MRANICGPHTLHKEGGTGEGRSSREGPWDKAEMWFPCDGCHRAAVGRPPSRVEESSDFWIFRQKCLIAPSASIPAPCGSSGMQGLTRPHAKYLKYFHFTLIFYFFICLHRVSDNLNYLETIPEPGPSCFLAGLCYVLLILH